MVRMTVRLSEDARRGWDRTCSRYGVTLTATLEALGLELLERGVASEQGKQVMARAQQIDFERRSRR